MSLSAPKNIKTNSNTTRIRRKNKKNEKLLAIDECKRLYQKYYAYPSSSLLKQLNDNYLKLFLDRLTFNDISIISQILTKYFYFQQIEIYPSDPDKIEPSPKRKIYRPPVLTPEEKSKIEKEKKLNEQSTKNMINKLIISLSKNITFSNSIILFALKNIEFTQKSCEYLSKAISNNKTQDEDYQYLSETMIRTENGINSLKNILKAYYTYSEPFTKYIQTLNEALKQIYHDSPLMYQIEKITMKHGLILGYISDLGKIVTKLYSKTSEWDTIFEKAKEMQKIREEKRKNFDHYEQKLLKIEGDQSKKKNTELLIRNQEKYSKALKEYLDLSEKSFEVIQNSLKLSWELTNPIIGEYFLSEKNLFQKISLALNDFGDITNILEKTMQRAFNPDESEMVENNNNIMYDPKSFIRSQTLMRRNDENSGYEHNFIRMSKTFPKAPKDRLMQFIGIKDDYPYK